MNTMIGILQNSIFPNSGRGGIRISLINFIRDCNSGGYGIDFFGHFSRSNSGEGGIKNWHFEALIPGGAESRATLPPFSKFVKYGLSAFSGKN